MRSKPRIGSKKDPEAEMNIPEMGQTPLVPEALNGRAYSIGSVMRMTYRAIFQDLQNRLAPHDIPIGIFFFLRVLWDEEGLTQRELGDRAGSLESATVEQLREMEERGLIRRRRSDDDRRKVHVYLTDHGRTLKDKLLPIGLDVNETALRGFTVGEAAFLRLALNKIKANVDAARSARAGATVALSRKKSSRFDF